MRYFVRMQDADVSEHSNGKRMALYVVDMKITQECYNVTALMGYVAFQAICPLKSNQVSKG